MFTVRFPSGVSIQYNTANYASRSASGYTDLYTKQGGDWIAQVPTAGCVIEAVAACRVYDAAHSSSELVGALLRVLNDRTARGGVPRYELADLKRLLDRSFNARSKRWKD